jgi:hypothetical protein
MGTPRGLGLATATTSAAFFPHCEQRRRSASSLSVIDQPTRRAIWHEVAEGPFDVGCDSSTRSYRWTVRVPVHPANNSRRVTANIAFRGWILRIIG